MPVKIIERENPIGVPISEMKDGDIAEIVSSGGFTGSVIVQRYGESLVVIGEDFGQGYSTMFKGSPANFRVKILPKGTTLEIT